MGLFRKNEDPFEARSRELSEQIRQLEKEIRDLNRSPAKAPPPAAVAPRSTGAAAPVEDGFRRDARPTSPRPMVAPPVAPAPPEADPRVNQHGVRKFDLASVLARVRDQFRGPSAGNPRMVQYLAAGTVHGLRPLRYERRVARNRFIGLFVLLVIVLFGLAKVYLLNGPTR